MSRRALFVIRHLDVGGAGRQLIELVKRLDRGAFEPHVAVFYPDGELQEEARALPDTCVHSLDKGGRYDVAGFLARWRALLRQVRPTLVHGYLDSANLLALTAPAITPCRVVWGVRSSDVDFSRYDWLHRLAFGAACRLSGRVDAVIFNSEAGLRFCRSRGYHARSMVVVPNGIDTQRYAHDNAARHRLRGEWGFSDGDIVAGIVARLDPMKGHEVLLDAIGTLARGIPPLRLLVVGGGAPAALDALRGRAGRLGISDRVTWTGSRGDVPAIYSAMDIAISASLYGEGFSNSIGEAMAAGLPGVVTAVGDAAEVIGEAGEVVAPGDATALAEAIRRLCSLGPAGRDALGQRARNRIIERYSLMELERKTRERLLEVCAADE